MKEELDFFVPVLAFAAVLADMHFFPTKNDTHNARTIRNGPAIEEFHEQRENAKCLAHLDGRDCSLNPKVTPNFTFIPVQRMCRGPSRDRVRFP